MDKKEILKNLTAFVDAENELAIKEAKNIITIFDMLIDTEKKEYERLSKENENSNELTNPIDDEENKNIIVLIEKFKKKRIEKEKNKKDEEADNLQLKKKILNDFKALIETNKNIGELINGIKKIREQWSKAGSVSQTKHSEIQSSYSKLNDEFNYNINIYKALKDNDLKRNYSLKNQIIHQLKELENETKIKTIEVKLKDLQNEWETIGATFKEHWEGLKNEYWEQVHALYGKIKLHYKQRKSNQEENFKIKSILIEETESLIKTEPADYHQWTDQTKEIKKIQDKWKATGPAPKKVNDELWKEFRSYCDDFFERKKIFFNAFNKSQKKHASDKKELIDKAKKLLENTNFSEGVKGIKKIQEDWKKIGHAGKFAEQKLWKNFRSICDEFFNNRKKEVKELEKIENENFNQKIQIINKLNSIDTQSSDAKEKINELIANFNLIGKVPHAKSNALFKQYEDTLSIKYKELKIPKDDIEKLKFDIKLTKIKESSSPEKNLMIEKDKLKRKLNHTLKEVLNYENNLGFFNNSSGNSSILKNVTSNIEKGKKEIEKLKAELKKLKI